MKLLDRVFPRVCVHGGHGRCARCLRPWCRAAEHVTDYEPSSGIFALCEACWSALTPEERLPYYHRVWLLWCDHGGTTSAEWARIEAAVMAGQ